MCKSSLIISKILEQLDLGLSGQLLWIRWADLVNDLEQPLSTTQGQHARVLDVALENIDLHRGGRANKGSHGETKKA